MKQRLLQAMLAIFLIGLPLTANSKIIYIEEVFEGAYIHTVAFSGNHQGSMKVKQCDDCPEIKLSFDKNTQIIENGRAISLKYLPSRAGKRIQLIKFNIKQKRATNIVF